MGSVYLWESPVRSDEELRSSGHGAAGYVAREAQGLSQRNIQCKYPAAIIIKVCFL